MTDHQYRELGPSYDQQLEDRLIAAVVEGFAAGANWEIVIPRNMAALSYEWVDAIIAERDRRIDRDAGTDLAGAQFRVGDFVEYRVATIHGPSAQAGTITHAYADASNGLGYQYMVAVNGRTVWKLERDLRRSVPAPDSTPLDNYPK